MKKLYVFTVILFLVNINIYSVDNQIIWTVDNLMGTKVATLVDETMGEGTHQVSFERVHLQAGIYFYTLTTASGYRENKKMTIR